MQKPGVKPIELRLDLPSILITDQAISRISKTYSGSRQGILYALETKEGLIGLVPEFMPLLDSERSISSVVANSLDEELAAFNQAMAPDRITYVPFFLVPKGKDNQLSLAEIMNSRGVIGPKELSLGSNQVIYGLLFLGYARCEKYKPKHAPLTELREYVEPGACMLGGIVSRSGLHPIETQRTETGILTPENLGKDYQELMRKSRQVRRILGRQIQPIRDSYK